MQDGALEQLISPELGLFRVYYYDGGDVQRAEHLCGDKLRSALPEIRADLKADRENWNAAEPPLACDGLACFYNSGEPGPYIGFYDFRRVESGSCSPASLDSSREPSIPRNRTGTRRPRSAAGGTRAAPHAEGATPPLDPLRTGRPPLTRRRRRAPRGRARGAEPLRIESRAASTPDAPPAPPRSRRRAPASRQRPQSLARRAPPPLRRHRVSGRWPGPKRPRRTLSRWSR